MTVFSYPNDGVTLPGRWKICQYQRAFALKWEQKWWRRLNRNCSIRDDIPNCRQEHTRNLPPSLRSGTTCRPGNSLRTLPWQWTWLQKAGNLKHISWSTLLIDGGVVFGVTSCVCRFTSRWRLWPPPVRFELRRYGSLFPRGYFYPDSIHLTPSQEDKWWMWAQNKSHI